MSRKKKPDLILFPMCCFQRQTFHRVSLLDCDLLRPLQGILFKLMAVFYGISIGWIMSRLVFAMELFCDVINRSCYNSLERLLIIISLLGYT